MKVKDQINDYFDSLPEAKGMEMRKLHTLLLSIDPAAKLWFLDGRDDAGKVVSNPNVGYGDLALKYADGSQKAFYKVGISANTTGISIYIMGLHDRKALNERYGKTLGKAVITGYCVKFKRLDDLNPDILNSMLAFGLQNH